MLLRARFQHLYHSWEESRPKEQRMCYQIKESLCAPTEKWDTYVSGPFIMRDDFFVIIASRDDWPCSRTHRSWSSSCKQRSGNCRAKHDRSWLMEESGKVPDTNMIRFVILVSAPIWLVVDLARVMPLRRPHWHGFESGAPISWE